MTGPLVKELDKGLFTKLRADLEEQGFTFSNLAYAAFQAKKEGLTVTLYLSGKLVVAGKRAAEFNEFYLEPELLGVAEAAPQEDVETHIGVDESGKGDFFGPLCVAAVFGGAVEVARLRSWGVKDSKLLTEKQILDLARKIRSELTHHIIRISPGKYNEVYAKFANLNKLLAWGHATCIENLHEKTGCKLAIIDQFAAEHVVATALKRKAINLELRQRHRAESDPIVAAASILARAAFVEGLEKLSEEAGFELPKGASQAVIKAGKALVARFGQESLGRFSKLHFKTRYHVLGLEPPSDV